MLTRLTIRNFKRFKEAVIDLDDPVLLIGPNNSGKTTLLQALALWDLGMRRWREKREIGEASARRPGVAIGRGDLITVPLRDAKHLWRNRRVRQGIPVEGRMRTDNIHIEIVVEGLSRGQDWKAGLEFDYANEESFHCRPLRTRPDGSERMPIPGEAASVRVAYLPPMSGLAAHETRLEPGAIAVRMGEGRTAEVLRNLCLRINTELPEEWERLERRIRDRFGVRLDPPKHVAERGEITMSYREHKERLDLTAAGRGLQQTMLLLAHLVLNPRSVLILDEPDAHLEVIRQRETCQLLRETASETGAQIIAASHSEVLLHEFAAKRDAIVALLGDPHRVDSKSQVLKALRDIGYADYEQARGAGFVLYLEGTTDLDILRAFARRLGHDAASTALDGAFFKPVGNQPQEAIRHFHGLREAVPALRGCALFDKLEKALPDMHGIPGVMWKRREIENYLCSDATLLAWAEAPRTPGEKRDLFSPRPFSPTERRDAMEEAIRKVREAVSLLRPGTDPALSRVKAGNEYLEPVFRAYFDRLGEKNRMGKNRFHELVPHIPDGDMDPEVGDKLDFITAAAND